MVLEACHEHTTCSTNVFTDMNRELVVKDLQKLVALMTEEELATIALIVLFNLCNDFGLYMYHDSPWPRTH